MEKRIHISKIWKLMQEKDKAGNPIPFSFQYAKLNGELKEYQNATFSSIHVRGVTVNIIPEGEKKPKSFRKILITRFNDSKVFL